MDSAFETIVEIYVRGKNRKAIQESIDHRRRLSSDLGAMEFGDHTGVISELSQEIALLEEGLKRIEAPADGAVDDGVGQAGAEEPPQPQTRDEAAAETSEVEPVQLATEPMAKQVEVLRVEISQQATAGSPAPAARPPGTPAQVHIVGLTIATSSSEAEEQPAGRPDGTAANDRLS